MEKRENIFGGNQSEAVLCCLYCLETEGGICKHHLTAVCIK